MEMNETPTRWLAVYRDDNGNSRATMITPSDASMMPFGVDGLETFLPDYNPGGGITLVEMPADADFRPLIVDWAEDEEAPLHFTTI